VIDTAPEGLHLAGVRHTYTSSSGSVEALASLDLAIEPGELVCILGPSGCGKSTLLELIAGLRTPSEGRITLDGRLIVGPSRRRGVVFQQSSSLYPWRSVRGNVELAVQLGGASRAVRRARADTELALVGLTEFADHRVYELSGGMQQRCQIARALAADPDVLLLDEPFGALDAMTRESLQTELRRIWLATGRTIVFVTHSVEEAVLLGSRVLVMSPRPGRLVADRRLGFSRSGRTSSELRGDPDFIAVCRELRGTIDRPVEQDVR
jgi:ABC-type nitrate/sulfonate/bicarbonate transport system ATPase subunit